MPCVILCAPVHTGSHPKSHFLFHIRSCRSWKHQFIITRQTLLEPVRLCLAVELDFPARNAGVDEHWVSQCILERMLSVVSYLLCQQVPSHCGASAAGLERLVWLLCSQERLRHRGKVEKLCHKRCHNETGQLVPTSPRGLEATFPICSFLVCHFTRTWETTKPYTQQWICRTVFFRLPSSSKFA